MNDRNQGVPLPELSDEAVDRIESAVLTEIRAGHSPARSTATRARLRRRRWLTGSGIAAAFVLGVLLTPPILGIVGGGSVTSTAGGGEVRMGDPLTDSSAPSTVTEESASGPTTVDTEASDLSREIIATAQATIRVDDVGAAADAVAALAEEHDGFVESTSIGQSALTDEASSPVPSSSGWISIRVPSADLNTVIDELDDTGEVLSSSISKQDVTSTAIDLRARVDATRASVQRLTELMAQSGSVSELIEAEVALTDRQAQLESYEQQLAALEDQVAMSTLQVELTRAASPTTADPAGFGDGLLAGWNGLVVSLNALVVAIGFLLPWLGIAAVVVLIVWLIRRARRRGRRGVVPPDPQE